MTTTVVDVPYAYLARGTAPRERGDKWHRMLGTVQVAIRTVDAPDASVRIALGSELRTFPVVDGRLLSPLGVVDTAAYGWLAPRTALTPALVADQMRFLLDAKGAGREGVWPGAPVDMTTAPHTGRVLPDGGLKTVAASDREERRASAFAAASSDLLLVGGVLCVAGREPLFVVDGPKDADKWSLRSVERTRMRATMRNQVADRSRGRIHWRHCLGLPGLVRLLEGGPVSIARESGRSEGAARDTAAGPIELLSSLDGIDWSDDAEYGAAVALTHLNACVAHVANGPAHLPDAAVLAANAAAATLMSWTAGSGAALPDLVAGIRSFEELVLDPGMGGAGIPETLTQEVVGRIADYGRWTTATGMECAAPSSDDAFLSM